MIILMCSNYDQKQSKTKLLKPICCPAIAALYFTFEHETWVHYFGVSQVELRGSNFYFTTS